MPLTQEICNAFNACATRYEKASKVQHIVGERLLSRLTYMRLQPRYILDLGTGCGTVAHALRKTFPKAQIMGLDIAPNMLKQAKAKQTWRYKWGLVQADMLKLPFADGMFDLIVSNQVVHWSSSLPILFQELYRVMRKQGCLLFSTMGPDTLRELRQAWQHVDSHAHVNAFPDMHDVGDMLLHSQYQDPVMDMEMLTVHYPDLASLLYSLKAQGVRNINQKRNAGLTGKALWRNFEHKMKTFCTEHGKFPLTYEVLYGQAWKGERCQSKGGTEVTIPVSQLRKRNQ